jgi:hypothetical protein
MMSSESDATLRAAEARDANAWIARWFDQQQDR